MPKKTRTHSDVRPVQFDIDGEKTKLRLIPSERSVFYGDVPVWTVQTDNQQSSGHSYQKLDRKDVNIDGTFYEDAHNNAMLCATYKEQYIYYDGVFGDSETMKVIRSIPEEWWAKPGSEFYRKHVVYNVDAENDGTKLVDSVDDYGKLITRRLATPIQDLYPKLLLIVENKLFKELGEDISETIKYVQTFWNAVNLKYGQLTSPQVNILVTGIIIAKDETALRYIYDARNKTNMDEVHPTNMLKAGSQYFETEFNKYVQFRNYDSTFTMANLTAGGVLGTAYPGKICSSHLNVGWVRDDGSFNGLLPATHELGHLLSLPHDNWQKGKDCQAVIENDVGTVMSPVTLSVKKLIWSECSKRILSDFASTEAAQCMETKYRE